MLGRLWIFQAALVISVAAECDKCDDTAMLQSSAGRKKDIDVDAASTWTSPRDVAILREPDQVRSNKRHGLVQRQSARFIWFYLYNGLWMFMDNYGGSMW